MSFELFSENCSTSSSVVSARISFSQDFSQTDVIPVEQVQQQQQHPFKAFNSTIDFNFHVTQSQELDESSSAEELFSDGRILPTQVKRKNNIPLKQKTHQLPAIAKTQPPPPLNPPPSYSRNVKKERLKELNDEVCDKQNSNSKSFWNFKRSSSCGSGYGRSLCPLPLLSRSNSTGSNSSGNSSTSKRNSISQKHSSTTTRLSHSSGPGPGPGPGPNSYQKPPLNNNFKSHRVNPVLNVPTANLFGLGSIFSNNRDKNKNKK